MRTLIRVRVSKRKVGKDLFERLKMFCAHDTPTTSITATFEPRDDRLIAMLAVLNEGGAVKVEDPFTELPDKGFRLETHFEFDDEDFRKASYFWFIAIPFVRAKRNGSGMLQLDRDSLDVNAQVAATGEGQTHVASSAFRSSLEVVGFKGIEFRATRIYVEVDAESHAVLDWAELPEYEPFWELSTSIELPPVSPNTRLHSRRGEKPVERGFVDDGVRVVPYGDRGPAMSYLADEVLQCEPFDIAFSKERFGPSNHADHRRLIVSPRFKEHCDMQGIEAKWFPVFLDE